MQRDLPISFLLTSIRASKKWAPKLVPIPRPRINWYPYAVAGMLVELTTLELRPRPTSWSTFPSKISHEPKFFFPMIKLEIMLANADASKSGRVLTPAWMGERLLTIWNR